MYQIIRPRDLLSLCLVSKHISEISFPQLYHDINLIDPPSCNEALKLNHVLNTISNSRGIKSVRIIRIPWFHEKFYKSTSNLVPLRLTFLTLLSRLEDNSLHKLECPRYSRDMLEYLCLHQKYTCNLRLMWTQFQSKRMADLLPNLFGMSGNVTELELDVGIAESPYLPTIDWSSLRKLRVMIHRRTAANIDTINTLLSRGLTSLTHLTIDGFHYSSTPLQVLKCPNLTHLSVLFDVIYRLDFGMKFNNPIIKHLEISSYHSRPGLVLCILRHLQGLKSLRVCTGLMSPKRSEALATSILSHKATLQLLILHNLSFTTLSSYAQFVHLARQCQRLSQLRLALGEEDLVENCKARRCPVPTFLHFS